MKMKFATASALSLATALRSTAAAAEAERGSATDSDTITKNGQRNRLAKNVASSYRLRNSVDHHNQLPISFNGVECNPMTTMAVSKDHALVSSRMKPDAGILHAQPPSLSHSSCGTSGRYACIVDSSSTMGGRCLHRTSSSPEMDEETSQSRTDETSSNNRALLSFTGPRPCLTQEGCEYKSQQMGLGPITIGDFPTRGCFTKNDKVFWSPATGPYAYSVYEADPNYEGIRNIDYEAITFDLPGIQERVCCGNCNAIDYYNITPCQTQQDCEVRSQELGFEWFRAGEYETKGCFSKNDNAFWSPGAVPGIVEEEMLLGNLPGKQERIWCKLDDVEGTNNGVSSSSGATTTTTTSTASSSGTTATTSSGTTATMSTEETACLTLEECTAKSEAMGFQNFRTGDYSSKGCFSKNDNAFWSPGSVEEMSETNLPGVQERIWCTTGDGANGLEGATFSTPTDSPVVVVVVGTTTTATTTATSSTATSSTATSVSATSSPTKKPTGDILDTGGRPPLSQEGQTTTTNATITTNIACLTAEECNAKSTELGFTIFMQGTYPTQGCFSKKNGNSNVAFFSPGTVEEMSDADMPGVQERIWCDNITSPTASPSESSAPTYVVEDIVDTIPVDMQAPTVSPVTIAVRPLKPGEGGVASDPVLKGSQPSQSPTKLPTGAPVAKGSSNEVEAPMPTLDESTQGGSANAAREGDANAGNSATSALFFFDVKNAAAIAAIIMMMTAPVFMF